MRDIAIVGQELDKHPEVSRTWFECTLEEDHCTNGAAPLGRAACKEIAWKAVGRKRTATLSFNWEECAFGL
jgi:hypothetical protein